MVIFKHPKRSSHVIFKWMYGRCLLYIKFTKPIAKQQGYYDCIFAHTFTLYQLLSLERRNNSFYNLFLLFSQIVQSYRIQKSAIKLSQERKKLEVNSRMKIGKLTNMWILKIDYWTINGQKNKLNGKLENI